MPFGVPALSAAEGTVSISEDIGTGGYVKIEHPQGLSTQYMHLKDRKVRAGQKVKAGQVLGTIHHNPNESHFPLVHLHFQVRKDGSVVDPEQLLAAAPILDAPWPLWVKLALAAGAGFAVYKIAKRRA
jgi:murein DD-endopeptidase MepM/ murein hydrolase activator NlpD